MAAAHTISYCTVLQWAAQRTSADMHTRGTGTLKSAASERSSLLLVKTAVWKSLSPVFFKMWLVDTSCDSVVECLPGWHKALAMTRMCLVLQWN